jgi:hypothetical protein
LPSSVSPNRSPNNKLDNMYLNVNPLRQVAVHTFRENRRENQSSVNRGNSWHLLATDGRWRSHTCPVHRLRSAPRGHSWHLSHETRPELRIRRLGVRIPPSALRAVDPVGWTAVMRMRPGRRGLAEHLQGFAWLAGGCRSIRAHLIDSSGPGALGAIGARRFANKNEGRSCVTSPTGRPSGARAHGTRHVGH